MLTTLLALGWLISILGPSLASAAPFVPRTEAGIKELWLVYDPRGEDVNAIKSAGFDTLVLFQVVVKPNATIEYFANNSPDDGSPSAVLADNGEYVGGQELASLFGSFKNGNTTVNRLEFSFCQGAYSEGTWTNIQGLLASEGTGSDSMLYRNLVALKEALGVDAINDDDEALYDVSSTVQFANLLSDIGLRFTTAPYTNQPFWQEVVSGINNTTLYDRTYLQCYDGGYGNDPGNWQDAIGAPVIPLLWSSNPSHPQQGYTPDQAQTQFFEWQASYNVVGGGIWDEADIISAANANFAGYGAALKAVFG